MRARDGAAINSNVIDWEALTRKLGDEPEFLRQLLGVVISTNTTVPAALRAAANTAEFQVIERLAHRTRGMAGDLVAHDCETLAREAEMAARARQPAATDLSVQLASCLEALLREAETHLAA
jgi:HPt (histidine-containing phosphotransfer) domain-containing protein